MSDEQRVIDYLDHPPQRYAHEFQRNSGSREMVESAEGEWVKFEDMDLYMFEGVQLMRQLATENANLRTENDYLRSRANLGVATLTEKEDGGRYG